MEDLEKSIVKSLNDLGINVVKEVVYNPSHDELYKYEMDPSLTGYDVGQNTELGAVNVMTGIFTGRSPKDKFIVKDKGEPEAVRRANAKWIGPFNEERLTLVTCWPYNNNTHRLIVIAKPVEQP